MSRTGSEPEFNDNNQSCCARSPPPLHVHFWRTAVTWTGLIVVSIAWNVSRQNRGVIDIARVHAATAFEKDLSYRRWVASHNVYVRVGGVTPNPYLKGLPKRDIESQDGMLTLVNPATMCREVYELERKTSQLRSHITSLRPIRRNNAPDGWEEKALKAFERGEQEVSSIEYMDGIEYMRLMRPVVTEQSCLRCHQEQGYTVGDIRGGISVAVPMEPLRAVTSAQTRTILAAHVFLWLFGLVGISAAKLMLRRQMRGRLMAERVLQQSESRLQMLAEHNARLNAEHSLLVTREKLILAATLQKRLLPQRTPVLPGYDVAAILRPCDETAGDFYDFLNMKDGSLAVVVGDVCGHGIDAALLMSTTIGHLRVLATYCGSAGEMVSRLNQLITQEAEGRFVTLFVAQLDTNSKLMSYASAGHRGYLIKPNGLVKTLDAHCPPLGILPELEIRNAPHMALEPGEIILMYTDGLSESLNADDEICGNRRILDWIQAHNSYKAEPIVEMLDNKIRHFTSGVEQEDDRTAVVVKVTEAL